ncbi:retrovirus-related pol polyprotein from transposon TNT 1-94 [Tanacetum coccineum]
MFYTSQEEIALNAFCRDQVKPLLNELLYHFDGFQNLFQRDIKEMKDAFEQNDVYLDEIERQNDLLKDQLLEVSLKHDIELCVLLSHECVDKSLHDELEQVKKKSLEIQEERDNAKIEYKKLFDSIKETRSQTQKEMDELITHVSEKTYAYGAICAENQNLLVTISELKARIKNGENAFKSKIDEASASKARDKASSKIKRKKRNMYDKPLSPFMLNKIWTSSLWQKWFESQSNVMWAPVNTKPHVHTNPSDTKPMVVQIVLWIVDSGCSKHMTDDRSLLRNFVEKFIGTVRFGNDNFAAITGYGDYTHGNITICHVYYVEGLGHNLFSVGQFCDGDLEVAFRSKTCYVRNLEGDDLLTGGRDSNLYTISISDMAASSPICLMSKATSISLLWHRRCHHHHLCSACERGKSKKASHPPKLIPSDYSKLELLHMDLCGPMRVASVNGKKYILVIVDDFSRFTWVYFLHSKDETPEIIKKFIAQAQLNYKAKVCKIRTDNGTEFKNATLKAHYERLGIMQQFSIARTPQQNGVVERRNRTLVEAARTMLIFSRLPEFLWAEAKANVGIFSICVGSLCYPTNDRDDLGKMKPKADIGVFIGYSETSRGFRIYNRRTKRIMETIHVKFDELTAMASEHDCLEPNLQRFNNPNSSDDLMNTPS